MTDPTTGLAAVLAFLDPDHSKAAHRAAITAAELLPDELQHVLDYVRRHPEAVRTRPDDAPPGLHRVLDQVAALPTEVITPPQCAGCGKQRRLRYRAPSGGRWCLSCYNASRRTPCRRCGTLAVPAAREDDGVLCASCRRADPDRRPPCSRCQRHRPVAYRIDGQPLCQACGPKKLYTCSACGRPDQPAHAITDTGPLCPRCYHRSRPRTCHHCTRSTPHARRDPDLPGKWICYRCYTPPNAECTICGQEKPCDRGVPTGRPICSSCRSKQRPHRQARPATKERCTICGLTRSVRITLPLGPVCDPCCHHLRENPITCTSCGHQRPQAGRDAHGHPLCGPCSGEHRNWYCRSCGTIDLLVTATDCLDCRNTAQVDHALHCTHPHLRAQTDSIRDLLLKAYPPRRTALLLASRHSWFILLTTLIAEDEPLTHASLDRTPPNTRTHHLRRLLIALEVLPPREDIVDGLNLWIDALLADQPPPIAVVLQPYATWHVTHRLRRARGNSPSAGKYARTRIRCAANFLHWLQDRDTDLAQATQYDVDTWLDQGATTRRRVRDFLTWTAGRGLTTDLHVPWLGTEGLPGHFLDEDTRWQLLRRCLTDPSLDLRMRVAGALVLLFGQNLIRIAALRAEDITTASDDTYLTLRDHPVLLPPVLATLVTNLAAQPAPIDDPRPPDTPIWLFPGRNAAHLDPSRLARLLNHDLGLDARAARGGALLALAADLPASVLADLNQQTKMGFFSNIFGKKNNASETGWRVGGTEDFMTLIRVYYQAVMASNFGIRDFRMLPDLRVFKQTLKVPTVNNRVGLGEKKQCKKMLQEIYGISDSFFTEIDNSIKRRCKNLQDMQTYLYQFQGFAQELMMLMGNLMKWKFRLPGFLKGTLQRLTEKAINDVMTRESWKDADVRKSVMNVRKYSQMLGYTPQWMTEFVYNVVILAKKEPQGDATAEN